MIGRFFNILYPEKCIICEEEEKFLCDKCLDRIRPILWQCLKCGHPQKKSHTPFCKNCLGESVVPDLTISLFRYDEISPIIIKLKEKASIRAKRALEFLIKKYLPYKLSLHENIPIEETILTRVPNHPFKVFKRGFDHTLEIAKLISKITGYRFVDKIVIKKRYTKSQKSLTKAEREKTVKDSFQCISKIPFRNIILVDDVITTMATINEVAKEIKNINPEVKIISLVIARTIHYE